MHDSRMNPRQGQGEGRAVRTHWVEREDLDTDCGVDKSILSTLNFLILKIIGDR